MVDLYAGLGGWAEGGLAEGFDVIGFDIERHVYGEHRYPAQLVLQDVLTLHGSQFRDAAVIVASPPCQEFSYMSMPWSLAKAKAAAIRADETGKMRADLTALFDACFRIQREAIEAAGHHIPLVVENVRGAIPWVERSRWNFGSYHLWGDVPALMPLTGLRKLAVDPSCHHGDGSLLANIVTGDGIKGAHGTPGSHWTNPTEREIKVAGLNFSGFGNPNYKTRGFNVTAAQRYRSEQEGIKMGGTWWNDTTNNICRRASSKSDSRKAASAMIAKIPLALSTHIARTFHPSRDVRRIEPPIVADEMFGP